MARIKSQNALAAFSLWRIRFFILVFFISLAALGLFIVKQVVDQLQWEAFFRFQNQAIEFSERIERNVRKWMREEDARSFGEYQFTVARGEPGNTFVQPSPLASLDLVSELPGLTGYFQLDQYNRFSSPLLPQQRSQARNFGLQESELKAREQREVQVQELLIANGLLKGKAEISETASLLDVLEEERVRQETQLRQSRQNQSLKELKLDDSLRKKSMAKSREQAELDEISELQKEKQLPSKKPSAAKMNEKLAPARVERELLVEQNLESSRASQTIRQDAGSFNLLESRIGYFSLLPLETHLLFYRQVWQGNERFLQGFLVDKEAFFKGLLAKEFRETRLAEMSTLAVVWQDQIISTYRVAGSNRSYLSSSEVPGGVLLDKQVLHKQTLPAPLGDWELLFTIEHLPAGPAARVIFFSTLSFLLILSIGCVLIYRLLIKHLRMANQQQNFVSSISHELKTPLTSIRMYGEMLKQGWVNEEKKAEYYDFIFHESERLTRLINNILQLARMTRSELPVNLQRCEAAELLDLIRSTISTQVSTAGFELELQAAHEKMEVQVDKDLFLQVIINLVDNALKFARKAENKRVNILFEKSVEQLRVSVRDFGPGIAPGDRKRIFKLFYRVENELTRETKGTGIGLALVSELLDLMHAKIEVVNCQPGAAFVLYFPLLKSQAG